jgi:hypothetical protein
MKFAVDSVCNHALAKHPKLVFWFCLEWLVLLITSVLSYLFLGSVVQSMINQQLAVGPDSDLFPLWKDPPVNPVMSIYLFNYTNVESWLNGSEIKLNVNQLGPYIYKEKWIKTNITFNDGYDIFQSTFDFRFSWIFLFFWISLLFSQVPKVLQLC